ncbi:hypothetical protein CAPTEDRAFT_220230 [Capitella teleta]|uniref:Centromere protein C n=1 Tax=Capitella teleta TaxID=283909 RepID=R7VFW9_CAPTE|nr:hypothetical protein CAPTEDRAFT_220230 [Capitella teleta]|eukprot:ELU17529.1 hypothetical protein CAPTEDRAFT_220230 [Capitella teleta]
MVNQLQKFILQLAHKTQPLRQLLNKDTGSLISPPNFSTLLSVNDKKFRRLLRGDEKNQLMTTYGWLKLIMSKTRKAASAIGRRTGVDVKKGKNIRKDNLGFENFDDYWSETDVTDIDDDLTSFADPNVSKIVPPGRSKQAIEAEKNSMQKNPVFIGRRTGRDVKAGKIIGKNAAGFDNFDDYWSETDADESILSNVMRKSSIVPSIHESISQSDTTKDESDATKDESDKVKDESDKTKERLAKTKQRQDKKAVTKVRDEDLTFAGTAVGSITRKAAEAAEKEAPSSALQSYRTRKKKICANKIPATEASSIEKPVTSLNASQRKSLTMKIPASEDSSVEKPVTSLDASQRKSSTSKKTDHKSARKSSGRNKKQSTDEGLEEKAESSWKSVDQKQEDKDEEEREVFVDRCEDNPVGENVEIENAVEVETHEVVAVPLRVVEDEAPVVMEVVAIDNQVNVEPSEGGVEDDFELEEEDVGSLFLSLKKTRRKESTALKKSEASLRKSEDDSRKSEGAFGKSEVVSGKSEADLQKSEPGSRTSDAASRKSEAASRKSEAASRKSEAASRKSVSRKSEIVPLTTEFQDEVEMGGHEEEECNSSVRRTLATAMTPVTITKRKNRAAAFGDRSAIIAKARMSNKSSVTWIDSAFALDAIASPIGAPIFMFKPVRLIERFTYPIFGHFSLVHTSWLPCVPTPKKPEPRRIRENNSTKITIEKEISSETEKPEVCSKINNFYVAFFHSLFVQDKGKVEKEIIVDEDDGNYEEDGNNVEDGNSDPDDNSKEYYDGDIDETILEDFLTLKSEESVDNNSELSDDLEKDGFKENSEDSQPIVEAPDHGSILPTNQDLSNDETDLEEDDLEDDLQDSEPIGSEYCTILPTIQEVSDDEFLDEELATAKTSKKRQKISPEAPPLSPPIVQLAPSPISQASPSAGKVSNNSSRKLKSSAKNRAVTSKEDTILQPGFSEASEEASPVVKATRTRRNKHQLSPLDDELERTEPLGKQSARSHSQKKKVRKGSDKSSVHISVLPSEKAQNVQFEPESFTPKSILKRPLKRRSSFYPDLPPTDSTPLHFYEVTKTAEAEDQPERKQVVKIVAPASPPSGLRRSKRTRVKPLDWFRNERILYSKRKSGGFVVAGIESPSSPNKPKQTVEKVVKRELRKQRRQAAARKALANQSVAPSPSAFEYQSEIPIVNPLSGEEVLVECMKKKRDFCFSGPSGESATDEDPLIMCKGLKQKAFSVGMLELRPWQGKSTQYVRNDSMVFVVIKGKVQVTIHKTSSIFENEDMFFVAQGNTYSIKNLRGDAAKLTFTQLKG